MIARPWHILVAAAAVVGLATGLMARRAAAQGDCPYQACDPEYHTCFNTDIRTRCLGGYKCHSSWCEKQETSDPVLPEVLGP